MKKKIILLAVIAAGLFSQAAHAQISLQVNIGTQPAWGPTGYDHVDYYYIPDVDAYYDVNAQQYVYMDGGAWVTRPYLPPRYANFDLYNAHKVVLNERTPWMHETQYRTRYAAYRGRHDQHPIRDSHDERYYANPGHPQHAQWQAQHGGNHGPQGGPRGGDRGPVRQAPQNHGPEQHGGPQQHGPQPQHGPEQHGPEQHGHEDHGHEEHGGESHGGEEHGGRH